MHMQSCFLFLSLIVGRNDATEPGVDKTDFKSLNDADGILHEVRKMTDSLVEQNKELQARTRAIVEENRRLTLSLDKAKEKVDNLEKWIMMRDKKEQQRNVLEEVLDYKQDIKNQVAVSYNDGIKGEVEEKHDTYNPVANDLVERGGVDHSKNRETKRKKRSRRLSTTSAQGQSNLQPVAFSAIVSTYSLSHVRSNQAIVFDQTLTNTDNAYDNVTGVFTAPRTGIYVFNFAVMVEPDGSEYMELVDDGMRVIRIFITAEGEGRYISTSRTVTVHVMRGSEIWVRANHGSDTIHGNGYTTFSGWLLSG